MGQRAWGEVTFTTFLSRSVPLFSLSWRNRFTDMNQDAEWWFALVLMVSDSHTITPIFLFFTGFPSLVHVAILTSAMLR